MSRRKRVEWTPEEIAEFRGRHARGETFKEISKAMGRPIGSCCGKAIALNLPARDRAEQHRKGYENSARARLRLTMNTPAPETPHV